MNLIKRNPIDMWLGHLVDIIFTWNDINTNKFKKNYDVLLIDGGLTTFDDFYVLPELKIYIFDDIDGIKGKKIFEFLNKDESYKLIFNSKTRNSCVFEKIKIID